MAKHEFVAGIQCKKCGYMIADIDIYTSELCQECGTHIMNANLTNRTYVVTKDGRDVIIKRTKRLFRPNTLEFVREI
jgi:deoxycytidylate deaminase